MDNSDLAKNIIDRILYITIATVTKEGQPWNTPVYSAYDEAYNFYWASDKNGRHSLNISDNSRVFLVIYDSTAAEGTGQGVYIQAQATELKDAAEIKKALACLYSRKNQHPEKRQPEEFLGEYPRRIYQAVARQAWINSSGKVNGNFIDTRIEVRLG